MTAPELFGVRPCPIRDCPHRVAVDAPPTPDGLPTARGGCPADDRTLAGWRTPCLGALRAHRRALHRIGAFAPDPQSVTASEHRSTP